ncbi:MAG: hypothetical protein CVV51_05530 [Spirochaetae bacterium HGW-Spirochaetae-7]|jgi:uncharacterized protein (TIGR03545 family)|nr:MAG: hypothetical protein CVV51_05530 [Spirochaetae bacterium HGW-Spirochaetae-7]
MKRQAKPAAILRKAIPGKSFERRYLGLLGQAADREFMASSFELVDGSYRLKAGLDDKALKRLNGLAKAIKLNRGAVKTGPLILAILLGTVLLAFGLFFMNPVLERGLERGLEAAFGARAEVSALHLDLVRLRISIGSIAVADRDDPMTNLFQTGRIELGLNLASLLRGRIFIEEATAASIEAGTPRSSSGALPDSSARPKATMATGSAAPPLVDFENFDAKALLQREKARLGSAAAFAEAQKSYDEATTRWKDRYESSGKALASLDATSKKILVLDPRSIRTPSEALAAAADAKALIGNARDVVKETGTIVRGIGADAETATSLEKRARVAVDEDLAYLKSLVDPKSGTAAKALEPSIREILSDRAERWLVYGNRALEVGLKLKSTSGGGETGRKAASIRGRDVIFPSAALPRFRLGLLSSSFAMDGSEYAFELRDVSTEPDLVASPASLRLDIAKNGAKAGFEAVADLRALSAEAYSAKATAEGYPLDLGDSLSAVGIGGFSGIADGRLELRGEKDGSVAATGGLTVHEPSARGASGTLGKALAEAVASVDAVELHARYETLASGDDRFTIDTNLDAIVAKALRAVAEKYAKKAGDELAAAMRDWIGTELEGKLASKTALADLLAGARSDDQAAVSLDGRLGAKVAAFEARAKELGTGALKGIGSGLSLPKVKP